MANNNESAAKRIIDEENAQGRQERGMIAGLLTERKLGALIWGENVFGCTDYPLISDKDSRTHTVRGVAVNDDGTADALIRFPDGEAITGVRGLNPTEAKVQAPADIRCDAGLPEQWGILLDCVRTALQVLTAERVDADWARFDGLGTEG